MNVPFLQSLTYLPEPYRLGVISFRSLAGGYRLDVFITREAVMPP